MDFWEMTRLVWRRRAFAGPVLLLTMLAAGLVGVTAEPDYRATGHVGVVPPAMHRIPPAGQAAQVNPWNEDALAHAASIRLEARPLADELAGAGYVGAWSVDVTGRLPVITIEVVAPTADQALAIMHQLQSVAEEEVRDRQVDYPLPDGEKFTSVRYQAGESVEPTRAKVFRALAAIMVAGLIVTAAVSVAADALLRRRAARRSPPTEPDQTKPSPAEPDPTEPDPTEPDPTEPDPTEPDPTEPDPTEPEPTEPEPTRPEPPVVAGTPVEATTP